MNQAGTNYLFYVQETLCCHVRAVSKWKGLLESPLLDPNLGPPCIDPVDSEEFSDVFHLSQYEQSTSQLANISTSKGRSPAHMFLVLGKLRHCFVKAFLSKGRWHLRCQSSNGRHLGSLCVCGQRVFKMIQSKPHLKEKFLDMQEASVYICSRSPATKVDDFSSYYTWSYDAYPNVLQPPEKRVKIEQFQDDQGINHPCVKPPKPPGDEWVMELHAVCCLVGEWQVDEDVWLMQWRNELTEEIVRVGPSSAVFLATGSKAKKHYAYDALVMCRTMWNILSNQSSIQRQHNEMKVYHHGDPGRKLPQFHQFAKHFHHFILAQVTCILDLTAYTHTNVHTCIHTYIHTYTHTHIHTYIHTDM